MQNNPYYTFGNQIPQRLPTEYQYYRLQELLCKNRMQIPHQHMPSFGFRPISQMGAYYQPLASPAYSFPGQMQYFNRGYQAYGYSPIPQIRYDQQNLIHYQPAQIHPNMPQQSIKRVSTFDRNQIVILSDDSNIEQEKNKTLKNQILTHEPLSKQKLLKQQNMGVNSTFCKNKEQGYKKLNFNSNFNIEQKRVFKNSKQKSQIHSTNQIKKQFKFQHKKQFSFSNQKPVQKKQRKPEKVKRISKPRKVQEKPKFVPIDRPRRNLPKKKFDEQLQEPPRCKEPAPKIMIGDEYQAQLPQHFIDKSNQVVWIQLKKRSLLLRLQKDQDQQTNIKYKKTRNLKIDQKVVSLSMAEQ